MKSVWIDSCSIEERPALCGNIDAQDVVIGAGLAGILIAYLLKKSGRDVVVLDRDTVGHGNTGNTTAKITSQHDIIYSKLISEFGEEKARHYAEANELAIKKYREIVKERNIDCDFEEKSAYVYSLTEDNLDKLREECECARILGIDAEYVTETGLPFEVKGAVKFNNQAQFNPLKFIDNISKDLKIYEHTTVLDVRDNVVSTDRGAIRAENVIIATHFPIINAPGFYFMKMNQDRSYVLALKNAGDVDGMYIDIDKKGYSFRNYKHLLLFGGISQRTGENESGGAYGKLRKAAKEIFKDAVEEYHWSAQDCMSLDGIPYIGEYSEFTENMYVATGFNKWGMTSSMVSAMIIHDMINGIDNDFADIFAPGRFDLSLSMKNAAVNTMETAKNFIAQKIHIPSESVSHIRKGCGGIVEYNGKKAGVYKTEEGETFVVSTKCPHLGCELKWNADELTWDCPCHGSRFDYKGKLLDNPSINNLTEELHD